jgi:hypothetical protein
MRVLHQIWVGADGNAIVTFDLDIKRLPAAVNMLLEPLKIRDLAPGHARAGRAMTRGENSSYRGPGPACRA